MFIMMFQVKCFSSNLYNSASTSTIHILSRKNTNDFFFIRLDRFINMCAMVCAGPFGSLFSLSDYFEKVICMAFIRRVFIFVLFFSSSFFFFFLISGLSLCAHDHSFIFIFGWWLWLWLICLCLLHVDRTYYSGPVPYSRSLSLVLKLDENNKK